MFLFCASMCVLLGSGAASLLLGANARRSAAIGSWGAVLGCGIGSAAALAAFLAPVATVSLEWSIPLGAIALGIDPLSAFFLLLVFVVSGLCAAYGRGYLAGHAGDGSHGWLFFNALVAAMALVVAARNAVLFLMAWEAMALTSFVLVVFDSAKPGVARAGLIYLVATQVGTAFLLVFFLVLGQHAGSLDFSELQSLGALPAPLAGALFLLALAGFGSKAGLAPMHVWLPEAHPVAPSHVSALMSAVMIKTGVYGILRALSFLHQPAAWWGWVLIASGAASAVGGILSAVAQRDLKRLLAYSSVENIGIVAMGLGMALLGHSTAHPSLVVLGLGAALFHVANHALCKSLLFLGAGCVSRLGGTLELDRLGGLFKKAPWAGACFLGGAIAICGLPPFNALASELLLYLGVLQGGIEMRSAGLAPLMLVLLALILTGGFAALALAKAFGSVFLGHPRRVPDAHLAPGVGWGMIAPMWLLLLGALALGLTAPFVFLALARMAATIEPFGSAFALFDARAVAHPLSRLAVVNGSLLFTVAAVAMLRRRLLSGREVRRAVTWDCGYAHPSSSMQYTASSLVQPTTRFFGAILRPNMKRPALQGYFPGSTSFSTVTPDLFLERFYLKLLSKADALTTRFRKIQHGRVQSYVSYILLTLVALLLWQLEGGR